MPCRSDYLEPSQRERELQRAAKLFVYACKKTGTTPPKWAVKEAKNIYADDERSVTRLCNKLKAMSAKRRDALVYNARSKTARDLADWWEEHLEADAEREGRAVWGDHHTAEDAVGVADRSHLARDERSRHRARGTGQVDEVQPVRALKRGDVCRLAVRGDRDDRGP